MLLYQIIDFKERSATTVSSFALKFIALISMTIDHFYKIIGQSGLHTLFPSLTSDITYPLCHFMDCIGRLAFPLFAFLVAEGAKKTRSMPQYLGRLALLAVISEPVFFFAFNWRMSPSWQDWLESLARLNLNNVFYTHLLSASVIYACQILEKKYDRLSRWAYIPVLLLAMFVAAYIGCDYGAMGVLLTVVLYFVHKNTHKTSAIILWSIGMYSYQISMFNLMECTFSSASAALICKYNGKRGRKIKWGFYFYYPVHLLLLLLCNKLIFS